MIQSEQTQANVDNHRRTKPSANIVCEGRLQGGRVGGWKEVKSDKKVNMRFSIFKKTTQVTQQHERDVYL